MIVALRNLTKVEDMLKEELYMFGDLIIVMVLTMYVYAPLIYTHFRK